MALIADCPSGKISIRLLTALTCLAMINLVVAIGNTACGGAAPPGSDSTAYVQDSIVTTSPPGVPLAS